MIFVHLIFIGIYNEKKPNEKLMQMYFELQDYHPLTNEPPLKLTVPVNVNVTNFRHY